MQVKPIGHADGVKEASGVARVGDNLLIITDASPGCYYSIALGDPAGPLLELPPERLKRHPLGGGEDGNDLAMDLEGLDVLNDGRVVAMSERLRSLLDSRGLVIQYDDAFSELGDRGLEGLAVRATPGGASEVAVLWEGGRIEDDDLQPQIRSLVNRDTQRKTVFRPFLLVHQLDAGARDMKLKLDGDQDLIELDIPQPEAANDGWRFRAPDLVWHKDGFIVLLNSQAIADRPGKTKYGPRWLQRFDREGKAVGQPLDLDVAAAQALAGDQRLADANWEGVGWFEANRRVVLAQDISKKGDAVPTALVIELPKEWQ